MGTAKFDDGVTSNPKLITAGPVACWMWFCGVLYCRRGLTDGFIPKPVIPSLVVGLTKPYTFASKLVEVGLWHEITDGYMVNGYLDWNPSKAAMNAYRQKDRERKQGRFLPEPHESFRSDSERIPNGFRTPPRTNARAHAESESESELGRLTGSGSSEESARETTVAPRWNREGRSPSLAGNHHIRCYASPACARGVCVPGWLATEWRQQYGDDTAMADVEISEVITTALAALPPSGPIGDEPKPFWRAVWKAAHGSQAPASGAIKSKGQITLDAARRFVLSRMQANGAAS